MNFVKPHVSGFAKEVWRERKREREVLAICKRKIEG
jgi:hypothetical protein